jgi:hypothetical protein
MPKEQGRGVFFDRQPDSSNVVTPSTRKNINSQTTRGVFFEGGVFFAVGSTFRYFVQQGAA